MSIRRVSVRYDRHEDEWSMRCDSCVSAGQTKGWWPLSLEFWDPRSGLQKCRACQRIERRRQRHQTIEERRAKQRAYYRAHHDERLAWKRAYHAAHREEQNRKRREVYAARKAAAEPLGLWSLDGP